MASVQTDQTGASSRTCMAARTSARLRYAVTKSSMQGASAGKPEPSEESPKAAEAEASEEEGEASVAPPGAAREKSAVTWRARSSRRAARLGRGAAAASGVSTALRPTLGIVSASLRASCVASLRASPVPGHTSANSW